MCSPHSHTGLRAHKVTLSSLQWGKPPHPLSLPPPNPARRREGFPPSHPLPLPVPAGSTMDSSRLLRLKPWEPRTRPLLQGADARKSSLSVCLSVYQLPLVLHTPLTPVCSFVFVSPSCLSVFLWLSLPLQRLSALFLAPFPCLCVSSSHSLRVILSAFLSPGFNVSIRERERVGGGKNARVGGHVDFCSAVPGDGVLPALFPMWTSACVCWCVPVFHRDLCLSVCCLCVSLCLSFSSSPSPTPLQLLPCKLQKEEEARPSRN